MATYLWILISITINLVVVGTALVLFGRKVDRALRRSNLLSQVQTEVQDILTELNQTTDRNIGLIENRISRLSRLIVDADRRITVLDSEQEKAAKARALHADIRGRSDQDSTVESADAQPTGAKFGAPGIENDRTADSEGRQSGADSAMAAKPGSGAGTVSGAGEYIHTPVQQRLFKGDDAVYRIGTDIEKYGRNSGPVAPRDVRHRNPDHRVDGAGTSRSSTGSRTVTGGDGSAEKISPSEIRRRVLDLYQKGFDAKMIAGKIGKTLGEVELIISLEKGKV